MERSLRSWNECSEQQAAGVNAPGHAVVALQNFHAVILRFLTLQHTEAGAVGMFMYLEGGEKIKNFLDSWVWTANSYLTCMEHTHKCTSFCSLLKIYIYQTEVCAVMEKVIALVGKWMSAAIRGPHNSI